MKWTEINRSYYHLGCLLSIHFPPYESPYAIEDYLGNILTN